MGTTKDADEIGEGLAGEAVRLLTRIAGLDGSGNLPRPMLFPDGIQSIDLRLELADVGRLDLKIEGSLKEVGLRARAPTERLSERVPLAADEAVDAAVPCTPANTTAASILGTCNQVWTGNNSDCNAFVKAAARPYFGDIFGDLNADGIVDFLSNSANGWTKTTSMADAISAAQSGRFVIAGMSAAELGGTSTHGHLAVVCGCPGQLSGDVVVPLAFAGSILGPEARIRGTRLSGSFPADDVRNGLVSYFSKAPP